MKNKPSPPPAMTRANNGFPGSSVFNSVPPPAKRKRAPLTPIDLAEVEVGATEPLPQTRYAGAPQWPVLLERLTAAGMHSSPLPVGYRLSLKAAASKWAKERGGKFTVRDISTTHLRIWRTE